MFINKNLDFELSTEESKELIRVLKSPACELVNKRKNFFAHGEQIHIISMGDSGFTAEIEDLDLSFLESDNSLQILIEECPIQRKDIRVSVNTVYQQYIKAVFENETQFTGYKDEFINNHGDLPKNEYIFRIQAIGQQKFCVSEDSSCYEVA